MKIAILGGGTWGITLAKVLFEKGENVFVWEALPSKVEILKEKRKEPNLPWLLIPLNIEITNELERVVEDANLIVSCLPSWAIREVFLKLKPLLKGEILIVSASKGLEEDTFLRPSEVIMDVIKDARVVALSGPSHAEEVSRGLPTAIVASSRKQDDMAFVQTLFSNLYLRVYTNPDIVGVELAGALKNIIAIACGISDGLGFGDNTKAALFCRGMTEIIRFGVALQGEKETFFGLAGMGDLMVTSISRHSRNRMFGELLGKGEKKADAERKINMVIEGIKTTKAVFEKSQQLNIEMPITEEVYRVIYEGKNPKESVVSLICRELKAE